MTFTNYSNIKVLMIGSIIAGLMSAVGCSTAQVRVMPGENGTNKIVVRDIERDDAEKAATDAAQEYCEKKGKNAIILSEETKYTGSMNEDARNTIRNASKVAKSIGFHTRDHTPGELSKPTTTETAGRVGSGMTSDRDYKSELSFKCE